MVSSSWTRMSVELGIIESTFMAFVMTIGVSLLVVIVFVGNLIVSI